MDITFNAICPGWVEMGRASPALLNLWGRISLIISPMETVGRVL